VAEAALPGGPPPDASVLSTIAAGQRRQCLGRVAPCLPPAGAGKAPLSVG